MPARTLTGTLIPLVQTSIVAIELGSVMSRKINSPGVSLLALVVFRTRTRVV